jgi:hypothetical protein
MRHLLLLPELTHCKANGTLFCQLYGQKQWVEHFLSALAIACTPAASAAALSVALMLLSAKS